MQSFQQGEAAFTEISFPALLRDGVSDTERDVFWAYAVSVFSEEQMMHANLQVIHYQSEFWPQSENLEESERYFETVWQGARRQDPVQYKRMYLAMANTR